jgi:hypothetical protein
MRFFSQFLSLLFLGAVISDSSVLGTAIPREESKFGIKKLVTRVTGTVERVGGDWIGSYEADIAASSVKSTAIDLAEEWYGQIPKVNGQPPIFIFAVICVEGKGCWGGTGE